MKTPKQLLEEHAQPFQLNQHTWDQRAEIHKHTPFYDVQGFLNGQSSLNEPELALLGDVHGKSLLHLQCHFGLDTLSFARLGAQVTGLDFSARAISIARQLQQETGLNAKFIHANVYELQSHITGQFDCVFSSYGALCWLPDLPLWAKCVASAIKPGGTLTLVEFHPAMGMLDFDTGRLAHPYFSGGGIREEVHNTYADTEAALTGEDVVWQHSLADIMTALLQAGIQLKTLVEYDYSSYDCYPNMRQTGPRRYQLHGLTGFPHMFGLQGCKSSLAG